jgi:hypothetical protein
MPMYWDARGTVEPFKGPKVEFMADFVYSVVFKQNYFEREFGLPEVFTLSGAGADDRNTVVLWAHMKRTIDTISAHILEHHPHGLAEHPEEDGSEPKEHGHFLPPVMVIIEDLATKQERGEDVSVSLEEYQEAGAELHQACGIKVAASNLKASADLIFADS